MQGRWSLTSSLFGEASASSSASPSRPSSSSLLAGASPPPLPSPERRRALAELLLERYGIVTREQVLAEGIRGGFALLYDSFAKLETLGVCRRGYFIEGMGGAQFALPGAVERLRATRTGPTAGASDNERTLVIAAADPAQPYGAALPWPKRAGQERRPARVAGRLCGHGRRSAGPVCRARRPRSRHARRRTAQRGVARPGRGRARGRLGKLALERIDGESALASPLAQALIDLGFHSGPRKLTLSA